jgi:hypothetical protein
MKHATAERIGTDGCLRFAILLSSSFQKMIPLFTDFCAKELTSQKLWADVNHFLKI